MFGESRASSRIIGKPIFLVVVSIASTLILSRGGICSDIAPSPMPAGVAVPGSHSDSGMATDVVAGTLEDKRRAVLAQIMAAKNQGCGIGAYLSEFNRIEDMVKSGQPYSVVDERLEKLHGNLDEQLKRAQILKVQRPVPTAPPPEMPNPSSPPGQSSERPVDQVKERFGNKLPGDLGTLDNLSPEIKDKLLKGDQGKELLKKFLGN